MSTYTAKSGAFKQDWYVIDATDKVLGRLASRVAHRLRGKHKAIYTPHVDTGDYVIVINADKVKVTGDKKNQKVYYRHTGYPGGIKATVYKDMNANKPIDVIEIAVKGMLPKGPLGREMFRKLKVYAGSEHPHTSQQPIVWEE